MPMMDTAPRPPPHGLSHDVQDRIEKDSAAGESHAVAPSAVSQAALRDPSTRPDATGRDLPPDPTALASHTPASKAPLVRDQRDIDALEFLTSLSAAAAQQQASQGGQLASSQGTSQETSNTASADSVFTPPASQNDMTQSQPNGNSSSQESQLLQLSQLAAAREKMLGADVMAPSRKRRADGEVKESSTSPVRAGHSRNTSTVSMASTTASTIGDLSHDLKTRLSYAMLKVNHGWQAHSIDEVESMASQAASPTSTNSTLPGRTGSSASPRLANLARNGPLSTTASSNPSPATYESFWRENGHTARRAHNSASPPSSAQHAPTLAPPAPIQPSRPTSLSQHPRRNSNPHYTPTLLSHSQSASPHTPLQSALRSNQRYGGRNNVDPILFSPHQDVREQDAAESLLFMSSPGNSGNMKHGYVPVISASQPLPGVRHALPTSQPRKTLPGHKPQAKRVGFDRSPSGLSDMDVDGQVRTPRGPVRRRVNGGSFSSYSPGHRSQLSLPAGLGNGSGRRRPQLADEDIERMLDRMVQSENDSSDDEEIQLPSQREGAGVIS